MMGSPPQLPNCDPLQHILSFEPVEQYRRNISVTLLPAPVTAAYPQDNSYYVVQASRD